MNDTPPVIVSEASFVGAGFGIRALARILDMVFGLMLGLIAGFMTGIILVIMEHTGSLAPGWRERLHGVNFTAFGLSLAGGFLYHSFCEGIHGASLGKIICQLRVVQQDGGPSRMRGALIRSLGWFVDSLFFGLIGYTSMEKTSLKQRYGDVWGKTAVLKAGDVPAGSSRSAGSFLAGFFIGSFCWLVTLVLGLIIRAL